MKLAAILSLNFIVCVLLSGCETVTNPDGTTSTRFDAKTTQTLIDTGFSSYERYQRANGPDAPKVYDQYGNPNYGPR